MPDKIQMAREIIKKYNELYDINFILKLEDTADELEFVFNNQKMNQIRSNNLENKIRNLNRTSMHFLRRQKN